MSRLVSCPVCARHMRATEQRCPFCGASIDDATRANVAPDTMRRLSRAAAFMFGATVMVGGVTAAGCGDETTASSGDGGDDAGAGQPAYGAPAVGGGGTDGSGGASDGGGGSTASGAALYGAPGGAGA